jgi:hypothetical protein
MAQHEMPQAASYVLHVHWCMIIDMLMVRCGRHDSSDGVGLGAVHTDDAYTCGLIACACIDTSYQTVCFSYILTWAYASTACVIEPTGARATCDASIAQQKA